MTSSAPKTAVLLINLGTPRSLSSGDIAVYLREFLSDPQVIDLPWPVRFALVNAIIVPFRTKKAQANYKKIWTDRGSPLRFLTEDVASNLHTQLGSDRAVFVAMRYGTPSIDDALTAIRARGISDVIAVPLFPQYSGAAWGSAADQLVKVARDRYSEINIRVVPPFYSHPKFVEAWASKLRDATTQQQNSHVLFSYHSLPVRQIFKANQTGHCRVDQTCCEQAVPPHCYRSQCYATSRLIAERSNLRPGTWSVAFQSRFDSSKWLGPQADHEFARLGNDGVQNLIVVSPSFVVDCLETIEELGMAGKRQFQEAGGQGFHLVNCLQDSREFITCLAELTSAQR